MLTMSFSPVHSIKYVHDLGGTILFSLRLQYLINISSTAVVPIHLTYEDGIRFSRHRENSMGPESGIQVYRRWKLGNR